MTENSELPPPPLPPRPSSADGAGGISELVKGLAAWVFVGGLLMLIVGPFMAYAGVSENCTWFSRSSAPSSVIDETEAEYEARVELLEERDQNECESRKRDNLLAGVVLTAIGIGLVVGAVIVRRN